MKKGSIVELELSGLAAEGKAFGKLEGKVVFVPFGHPGDVVKVRLLKVKSAYCEGAITEWVQRSADRVDPPCAHFGHCGGCKWQHVSYERQADAKHRQVIDQLERIGGFEIPEPRPILAAASPWAYRNKLDFSFSTGRWLTAEQIQSGVEFPKEGACGFHVPGRFDKVLEIEDCHLMNAEVNRIRNLIKTKARERGWSFYHPYNHVGHLRNLVFRSNRNGEFLIWVIVGPDAQATLGDFLSSISEDISEEHRIVFSINSKKNDALHDLVVEPYRGEPFITETLGKVSYRISPQSFFQTNPDQAERMYQTVLELAHLSGEERVYDLYCGTGSIALFLAEKAKFVLGIEYVQEAVNDAFQNAQLNGIEHVHFLAGDMKNLLNENTISEYGMPDVVVVDPPRAGMHEDVVQRLLTMKAKTLIYVSCNPATQARDLALLTPIYHLDVVQPIDMFPHTHHVENIVRLTLRP
jgi:23S rRNA (uracil1939-C5)-methyltransferase